MASRKKAVTSKEEAAGTKNRGADSGKKKASVTAVPKGKTGKTGAGGETAALNAEHEKLRTWLAEVRFRKKLFGGVSSEDLWRKLEELNAHYENALISERARYDTLLTTYTQATNGKLLSYQRALQAEQAKTKQLTEELETLQTAYTRVVREIQGGAAREQARAQSAAGSYEQTAEAVSAVLEGTEPAAPAEAVPGKSTDTFLEDLEPAGGDARELEQTLQALSASVREG